MQQGVSRTSVQLYRDCLRLVNHMAGNSAKGNQLRAIVRGEFKRNKDVHDEEKVAALKTEYVHAAATAAATADRCTSCDLNHALPACRCCESSSVL